MSWLRDPWWARSVAEQMSGLSFSCLTNSFCNFVTCLLLSHSVQPMFTASRITPVEYIETPHHIQLTQSLPSHLGCELTVLYLKARSVLSHQHSLQYLTSGFFLLLLGVKISSRKHLYFIFMKTWARWFSSPCKVATVLPQFLLFQPLKWPLVILSQCYSSQASNTLAKSLTTISCTMITVTCETKGIYSFKCLLNCETKKTALIGLKL